MTANYSARWKSWESDGQSPAKSMYHPLSSACKIIASFTRTSRKKTKTGLAAASIMHYQCSSYWDLMNLMGHVQAQRHWTAKLCPWILSVLISRLASGQTTNSTTLIAAYRMHCIVSDFMSTKCIQRCPPQMHHGHRIHHIGTHQRAILPQATES